MCEYQIINQRDIGLQASKHLNIYAQRKEGLIFIGELVI